MKSLDNRLNKLEAENSVPLWHGRIIAVINDKGTFDTIMTDSKGKRKECNLSPSALQKLIAKTDKEVLTVL